MRITIIELKITLKLRRQQLQKKELKINKTKSETL